MRNTILELSSEDARKFFLREGNYCTLELPPYFSFQPLLDALSNSECVPRTIGQTSDGDLDTFTRALKNYPAEEVNYRIYLNKGGLSWRMLQLINPVAYVYLTNIITEPKSWKLIRRRFEQFQSNPNILCCSLPLINSAESTNENAIKNWRENFQNVAIKQALHYDYLLATDIANCYDSIYTHSVAWALHRKGKAGAKQEKGNKRCAKIWNAVDVVIQNISYQQTNGIPQGSTLMDFIAEIVLGYADSLLSDSISEDDDLKDKPYKILRYRDDYRIFTKAKNTAERIARHLTEVLTMLNLRLNDSKTFISDDIIADVQKPENRYCRDIAECNNLIQRLLQIYSVAKKYPNSGALSKILSEFYDKISKENLGVYDLELIGSITTNIAYYNPRVCPQAIAILGRVLSLMNVNETNDFVDAIMKKFSGIPNTEYLSIWLQRLFIKGNKLMPNNETIVSGALCDYAEAVSNKKKFPEIWEYKAFGKSEINKAFQNNPVVDFNKINEMSDVPDASEFKMFNGYFNL